ncbi:hypothetical protein D7Y13_37920 [Corallococcus praedator]|uniref:Lipoprotein n=1 Tax=Corallococcus praedator TaxID=2316724 RepID=A0ABX9Q5F1_9BACT|nr:MULTISPECIES: hypothetical protein [Corallococcus]RKH08432.1 hypothetical protein D7X74_31580 [Corallococcus sp. CA047B]RKH23776.1 hypothetical protein D7X75_33080 [Corallococcus sp. CA031C]RKH92151.1 hypothetical protein D7Y13_37920 [Corallococcus praedator]
MKKFLFGLAAMASLSLTACGGSLCDDSQDVADDLFDKAEACGVTTTKPPEPTDAQKEACEESLDACSDSDKDKVGEWFSCLKDAEGCDDKTLAEQEAYNDRLEACTSKLAGVSSACLFAE